MPFVLTCFDKANAGVIRAENRPAHLDHVRRWGARVVTAGPLLAEDEKTPVGSLFILDVPSRAEAERFAAEDPYAKAGLFQSVTIRAWRKVFPEA